MEFTIYDENHYDSIRKMVNDEINKIIKKV